MDQFNNNPLQKYFRAPGLTIQLPSQGRFQPEGNVTFSALDDVPVYPMRGQDEHLMKNPDALMSGMAVEEVIKSCVPSIKNPRLLPTPDVDALLLAIRAATYGNTMTIESDCPSCQYTNAYDVDVSAVLETIKPLNDEYSVRLSDEVVVYLRPSNLVNSTKAGNALFQETRRINLLDQTDASDDDRQAVINASFTRLNDMNMEILADCVEKVVTPDGVVVDRNHIVGFVNNIPRDWTAKLEEELKLANESGIDKNYHVACAKCNHEWDTQVEFDPTTFFGPSS